ncbi:methyltransferase, TIGR04325 family [Pseudomarimonas salicorniae]|uniref:Methyltransferase, TIGR04325 family n=1 Tax=Pseudomarimonas salicorniae TaxID=2933270 RepID=A0ABT0GKC7_9GAMM|nr:methyltransferase, TIGR04325 family [Lysobacter sp. CAU 1642]MCK7594827.1 methyltransferase, TIGR04325 family [Lysobacter sp. CAU 1642]
MYVSRWSSRIGRLLDRLPPFSWINRALYKRAFARNRHENLFLGVYGSFAEAAAAAPQVKPVGYDNEGSVALYGDELRPRDYPAVFWIDRLVAAGARRVFDLGGYTGIKHYGFSRLIDYPEDLVWTVGDVPAVVEEGRRVAEARGLESRLKFTTDMADMVTADLLFASGSVQFLEESPGAILQRTGARPRWIVLNTSAIHPKLSYITLNSIGTAFCPYRVQSRDSLVAELEALGYRLVDEWRNPGKGITVPFHRECDLEEYRGFCFERANAG